MRSERNKVALLTNISGKKKTEVGTGGKLQIFCA
jgi:hypothetical protein